MDSRLFSRICLIVVLCAKEMKTHNRTHNHFIRINTWQDSDKSSTPVPLPITEFLAGRSSSAPGSDQTSGPISCADGDALCSERTTSKRQVDPLHSCIEAKCSSWNSGNYLDCVYRHCVSGFQLHGKRSVDDEEESADDSFGRPEGRFLLLPLAFDSSTVDPDIISEILESSSEGEQVSDTWRAHMASLARRLMSSSRDDSSQQHDRKKRSLAEFNRGRTTEAIRQRGSMAARLRASLLPKRSYNDIADVCVEHHCGQMLPHTISYFQCVDHHCTGK